MFKNPFYLFGLGVVLVLMFLPSYQRMQDLKQKNTDFQLRMQELVRENAQLTEEKRLLKDDPVYLEKVAREKMGLIKEGEKYVILSDIQGLEDHLGDMDFKVAGTDKGITALQMDIKITGLTAELMAEALKLTGIRTKREAVETALRLLVQLRRQEQARQFRGKLEWVGDLDEQRGSR